jgi:hypothetical protein
MKARPERWQYLQDAGFVYYWSLRDYKTAADWFQKASEIHGAPWWLQALAAVTRAQGGERRGSRLLWQQLAQTADNEWLKNEANRRLIQLDALDQIDQLQAIVARFVRQTNRRPASWADLVKAGFLRGMPLDPTGVGYVLDPATGAVTGPANRNCSRYRSSRRGRSTVPSAFLHRRRGVRAVIGSLNVHSACRAASPSWPASRCTPAAVLSRMRTFPSSHVALGACRHAARPSPVYPAVELATSVVSSRWRGWAHAPAPRRGHPRVRGRALRDRSRHRSCPTRSPWADPGGLCVQPGNAAGCRSLIGIIAGGGSLLLIAELYRLIRREDGLGMGDVKMLALIGAFLGWKLMLLTLVLSSLLGSVIGIAMIAGRKGDMKYALPFGTFLSAAALIASVAGDAIVEWYMGFY